MSGVPRTARLLRPLCPRLCAAALLLSAACGGRDAVEDAPEPLSTGIPAAAPNARGASIHVGGNTGGDPRGVPPAPTRMRRLPSPPEEPPLPPDPFGTPDPPLEPPAAGSAKPQGMQL